MTEPHSKQRTMPVFFSIKGCLSLDACAVQCTKISHVRIPTPSECRRIRNLTLPEKKHPTPHGCQQRERTSRQRPKQLSQNSALSVNTREGLSLPPKRKTVAKCSGIASTAGMQLLCNRRATLKRPLGRPPAPAYIACDTPERVAEG